MITKLLDKQGILTQLIILHGIVLSVTASQLEFLPDFRAEQRRMYHLQLRKLWQAIHIDNRELLEKSKQEGSLHSFALSLSISHDEHSLEATSLDKPSAPSRG